MQKYSKVLRFGKQGTKQTIEGNPEVVIMEKLDGANASFKRGEYGTLKCFSRNNELDEHDTLRGFYTWAQETINPDDLLPGEIYFGEWLVRHKIDYGDNEKQFYLFDIFSEETEQYLSFDYVKYEARELGINLAPVFYEGPFQSMEHVESFVGQSKLGEVGEGVVLKNHAYTDRFGNQVFTKIVSDQFAEKSNQKKHKPQKQPDQLDRFIDEYLTKPRVEKMVAKLVDEGVIDEQYGIEDTGTVLKNSASRMADDIIEEEYEDITKVIRKKVGKKYPQVVREVLSQRKEQ